MNYLSSGTSGVVNQVEDVYNGLGQLTGQYQADGGTVALTGTASPEVQYGYSSAATGSRLITMTYPNGRILHYLYDTDTGTATTSLDNAIGRLDGIADDDGSGSPGQQLEDYSYLGLSTIVVQNRPEIGFELSLIGNSGDSANITDGGDQYTGLDRFGRVVDQDWKIDVSGNSVDRFQYGYDADGDVLYENNLLLPQLSALYHANSASMAMTRRRMMI